MAMLDDVLVSLYDLVRFEARTISSTGTTTAGGHSFEDLVSQKVHGLSRKLGFLSNPARHTLDLPTFSGIKHQFDCSFTLDDILFLVECKRRKMSTKEQIYYFNSTVSDYVLGCRLRGLQKKLGALFLSTAEVDNNSLNYALSYGITVIDPTHPPIGVLVKQSKDSELTIALERLRSEIPNESPLREPKLRQEFSPAELLRAYLFLASRSHSQ